MLIFAAFAVLSPASQVVGAEAADSTVFTFLVVLLHTFVFLYPMLIMVSEKIAKRFVDMHATKPITIQKSTSFKHQRLLRNLSLLLPGAILHPKSKLVQSTLLLFALMWSKHRRDWRIVGATCRAASAVKP